jgi:hypothetical protein
MSVDLKAFGSFDPGVLHILYQVFDDVWSTLAPKTDPGIRDGTRNIIATALIQAAMTGERDPERLWCHAMNRARALSTLYWMSSEAPHAGAPAHLQSSTSLPKSPAQ